MRSHCIIMHILTERKKEKMTMKNWKKLIALTLGAAL